MAQFDQEEPDARLALRPKDPEFLREAAAAVGADRLGPKVRVTVELSPRAAAVLMLTGKGWIGRYRRLEAVAHRREIEPWTEADILPFEVARRLEAAASETARNWSDDPWIALILAARRGKAESGE